MITQKRTQRRSSKSLKSYSSLRLTSRCVLLALAALILTSTLAVVYVWLRQAAAVIRTADTNEAVTITAKESDLPIPTPPFKADSEPHTQQRPSPPVHQQQQQRNAAATDIKPTSDESHTAAELECSKRLGSGLLQHWAGTHQPFIAHPTTLTVADSSTHSTPPIPLHPGTLDCSSITIPHMPPPTAPHSFCTATHLYIFPHTFQSAQAPAHRSHYAFGTMQHWRYPTGAFALYGQETGKRRLDAISADHMRDSIEATQAVADGAALQSRIQSIAASNRRAMCDDCLLLLVTREAGEHVNLYHTMTDWYNAYLMLVHLHYTTPERLAKVRLLFLDNHPVGYLDPLWQSVFSPAHPVLTVRNLTAAGDTVLYSPLVAFSPAGYSCPIWVHLREEDQCVDEVDMMGEFGRFVKRQLGVTDTQLTLPLIDQWYGRGSNDSPYGSGVIEQYTQPFAGYKGEVGKGKVLHVVVVSRRPYKTATVDHSTVNRQIFNEPDLLTALRSITATLHPATFSHLHLALVDFARIPINTQILLCSHTDLLIGVHGAALSHALFLPPLAALLELQPAQQNWRIFQHMQQWSHRQGVGESKAKEGWEGLDGAHSSHYGEWRNSVPGRERRQASGDGMDVDVEGVKAEVERLVRWRDWKETQLATTAAAS